MHSDHKLKSLGEIPRSARNDRTVFAKITCHTCRGFRCRESSAGTPTLRAPFVASASPPTIHDI